MSLREILASEGFTRKSSEKHDFWRSHAVEIDDPLFSKYTEWVIKQGHITPAASSVLQAFIDEQGLQTKDYKHLAKLLGFKGY